MSDTQRPSTPQPAEIASLQESMLDALLLQLRLAGSAIPIDLLHRLGLGDRDTFYLIAEHLSPLINHDHLPAPVRIVPSTGIAIDIAAIAGCGGNPVIIEFSPPREEVGGVRLTLRIWSYSGQPSVARRNLGTLEVLFARAGNRWLVHGAPTVHVIHPGRQP
jgi:hypothetical protein